jgi:hypothetical protein
MSEGELEVFSFKGERGGDVLVAVPSPFPWR